MPKLNREQLFAFEVALPPTKVQRQIVSDIQSERDLIDANRKLIGIFEKKIQDKLAEIWGEASTGK
jgi:type I restriction enzyme M protein